MKVKTVIHGISVVALVGTMAVSTTSCSKAGSLLDKVTSHLPGGCSRDQEADTLAEYQDRIDEMNDELEGLEDDAAKTTFDGHGFFSGSLNDKYDVEMSLEFSEDGKLKGEYYYIKDGEPTSGELEVEGFYAYESEGEYSVKFFENNADGRPTGTWEGTLNVASMSADLNGKMVNYKGTEFTFSLRGAIQ